MNFDRSAILKSWEMITQDIYVNLNDQLGKGSFGKVYTGYSRKKDSLIAIKLINLAGTGVSSQRQIQTLKDLSSLTHPNIMGYYGNTIKDNTAYIFIEYCPNGTLKDLVDKRLSQIQVLKLFRQLVEGMCYMNAKNKMHRDLKPQNILIGPQNDVKISDFGLAQSTNSIFVTGKQGTAIYAAPQVFLVQVTQQQSYTNKCDVWGGGMILYQMLTGQSLFKGVSNYPQLKNQWLLYERGLKKAEYNGPYHPLWQYFTNWMLIFDPKRRPTYHEVLQNLKKIYPKMKAQLQNGSEIKISPELQRLDSYIFFQIQKYQLLLDLCQIFTSQDIRLANEFKYLIMFLCILKYIVFTKKFIRDLKYKRIKYNQKDLISNNSDIEVEMFIDKHRFIIEHRLEFYNMQIKKTIIPKILNTYCKREESIHILKELEDITKMVTDFSEGQMGFSQEICADALKSMLPIIQKRHKNVTQYYNPEQLRIYLKILIVMLIDQRLPTEKFSDKNFVKNMSQRIKSSSKQDLIKEINILRGQLL